MDAWTKILHEVDPATWPEDWYSNVPHTCIYNTDEQGPNLTSLQNPVLVPADMVKERSRLFQKTQEGNGKMTFHYSVDIVRADGVQCHPHQSVKGAPAPCILISDDASNNELDTMEKGDRDKRLAN